VSILNLILISTWSCYGVYCRSHSFGYLVLLWLRCPISRLGFTNIWFCCGVCSRSLWYGVYSQSHAYGFTINLVLLQRLYRCHAFGYLVSATATVSILNLTPWIYHKVGSATVSILNLMPMATWSIFSRSRSHAYTYLVLLWLQCLFSSQVDGYGCLVPLRCRFSISAYCVTNNLDSLQCLFPISCLFGFKSNVNLVVSRPKSIFCPWSIR